MLQRTFEAGALAGRDEGPKACERSVVDHGEKRDLVLETVAIRSDQGAVGERLPPGDDQITGLSPRGVLALWCLETRALEAAAEMVGPRAIADHDDPRRVQFSLDAPRVARPQREEQNLRVCHRVAALEIPVSRHDGHMVLVLGLVLRLHEQHHERGFPWPK